ncbi:MAG: hypothetical protein RSB55_04695 [Oscillospiraceae bacterium]
MESIQELTHILQILIPIGAGARIAYCLSAMAMDSDEDKSYKTRIRNTLVFVVLAEVAAPLLLAVIRYY